MNGFISTFHPKAEFAIRGNEAPQKGVSGASQRLDLHGMQLNGGEPESRANRMPCMAKQLSGSRPFLFGEKISITLKSRPKGFECA